MSPKPTGRVVPTANGVDLVLTRTFRAPIDDVWKSVTESDRTARWFGRWEGEAGPGKEVTLYMGFEKDAKPAAMQIDACRPPHHLAVSMKDAFGEWRLELSLAPSGDDTTLTFTQHLADASGVGDIGPGWEYYLDMLVASREGKPLPAFGDYYPAQRDYYVAQAPVSSA
jgi:uncharacterized protein YndB with AHSA1/START domain